MADTRYDLRRFAVFSGLLILSGIAAMCYQIVWLRLLSFTFGSATESISIVLTGFFAGLSTGSLLTGKFAHSCIDLIRLYLALELGIALAALGLLPVLLHLPEILASFPMDIQSPLVKSLVCFVLLIIPAAGIGATFPVVVLYLAPFRSGKRCNTSILYGFNTLGAVLGSFLAGFAFIPALGLDGTIYLAATLNGLIVCVLFFLGQGDAKTAAFYASQPTHEAQQNHHENTRSPIPARSVLFFSGFITLALENTLTKYLSIFTGSTIYGFSIILTSFLLGISLGAWLISLFVQKVERPLRLLWLLTVFLLFILGITKILLNHLPDAFHWINAMTAPVDFKHLLRYLVVFALLMPLATVLGTFFPIGLRLYTNATGPGNAKLLGKAYALNTLAGILGALLSGLFIIPYFSSETLLDLILLSSAGLCLILGFTFYRQHQPRVLVASVGVILIGFVLHSPLELQRLIDNVDYRHGYFAPDKTPEFLYLSEGKNAVVSLISYDGKFARLQSNGISESMLYIEEPEKALLMESLLAYLPYFLHEEPKTAFVIGLGGGVTTRAFTHTPLQIIQVVEIEEKIVEAVRVLPQGPATALNDPRVRLILNDARNELLNSKEQFDIISSQPSHPWTLGAANVLTREFFQLAGTKLNANGIFAQWINLFRMDNTTLRSIWKAFYEVFAHGFSIVSPETGDLILIGSASPLRFDIEKIKRRMQQPAIARVLKQYRIHDPIDLTWFFALSRQEMWQLSSGSVANRDTNLLSEVRLANLHEPPPPAENPYQLIKINYRFDIAGVLPETQKANVLYRAALRFARWNKPAMAHIAVDQLQKYQPERADYVRSILNLTQR